MWEHIKNNWTLGLIPFLIAVIWVSGCSGKTDSYVIPKNTQQISTKSPRNTFAHTEIDLATEKPTHTTCPEFSAAPTKNPRDVTLTPFLTVSQLNDPKFFVNLGEDDGHYHSGVLKISQNSKLLALARYGNVKIWDINSYQLISEFTIPHETFYAKDIDISSDASIIAVSFISSSVNVSHLMIWEINNGILIHDWLLSPAKMKGTTEDYVIPVYGLEFFTNSSILAYSNGNSVELKDIYKNDDPITIDLGEKCMQLMYHFLKIQNT